MGVDDAGLGWIGEGTEDVSCETGRGDVQHTWPGRHMARTTHGSQGGMA